MPKLMIDDPTRLDPLALITTAKIAASSDVVAHTNEYLTTDGDNSLAVIEGTVISVGENIYKTRADSLGIANLDSGSAFLLGRDYYVYICDDGTIEEAYRISLNTTFPAGFNAANSRKIGGFHFGMARRVDSRTRPINTQGIVFGTGWEANVYMGIVPRSVWTLKHRPRCEPESMVYSGHGLWIDIYLSSDDGNGGVQSSHGMLPITGTEGYNWYTFVDRYLMSDKRMPSHAEWLQAAFGAPQGLAENNDNAHTRSAAPANTARAVCGSVARAVSAIGCVDTTGNVWEWNDDLLTMASGRVLAGTTNPTPFTFASSDGSRRGQTVTNGTAHGPTTRGDNSPNSAQGAWAWDRVSPLGETAPGGNPNNGNIHQYFDQSISALLAGGAWDNGMYAGSRAVHLSGFPWHVGSNVGARGACESL